METYLDCIPCFFRQALGISRLAKADEQTCRAIVNDVAALVPLMTGQTCPPEIGRLVNESIYKHLGRRDYFKEIKAESNRKALALVAALAERITTSPDPLRTSVELAIAGNIIDYGAKHTVDLERELLKIAKHDFGPDNHNVFEYEAFQKDLEQTAWILYLADNAGETVFDRLLIEQMARTTKIIYVVREQPVINDALREDALECGIDQFARIISSGSDAPGTVLSRCSPEFIRLFESAPLIISKGQGNYEALAEENRHIYFLLKIKCELIARHIGGSPGDMVLRKTRYRKEK